MPLECENGVLYVALAILGVVGPLLALPRALGSRRIVRHAAVAALFIVPLFTDALYLAWHWRGGPSVVISGPLWLAVLMYYPLAVIWSGFWAALIVAFVVRAMGVGDSNSAAAGDGGPAPTSTDARRA